MGTGLAKSFHDSNKTDTDKAMASLSQTLLGSLAREAICADAEEHIRFQNCILELDTRLRNTQQSAEIYAISAAADKALQDYKTQSTKYFRNQAAELQSMTSAAIRTVADIHCNSAGSLESLREMEQQVLRASSAASLVECRLKLNECLAMLREESKRQQQQTSQMVARLHSELNHGNNASARTNQAGNDPVSGLPSRPDGEAMLASRYNGQHSGAFAALFCVHRINIINTKYGYAAGDQVMRAFLSHLRNYLTIVDDLYRWSGPSFLAIVHRPAGADPFRREIARILGKRFEQELALPNRTALLPVSASALVLEFSRESSVDSVIKKLDDFSLSNL